MEECIFCSIAAKEAPAKIVWEDDNVLAFWDLHLAAKVHVLIIPKHHISSLNEVTEQDKVVMGRLMCAVPKVSKILKLDHFKLECHTGRASGQSVFHLHLHLLQN
jgi:histidine triad (HIT) family protein